MSRQQRRAQARARKHPTPNRWMPWLIGAAVVAAVVGLFVYLGAQPLTPKTGDHWHAGFKVIICGERTPPLPAGPGDLHSHGDDVMHIHPNRPESAGRNATIGAFLRSVPLKVTQSAIEVTGKTYTNGDKCADGRAGRVSVLVNGKAKTDFESYVPQDRDQIEFRFGP
ncbi:MAG: hypothetical protein ACT4PY_12150 [Armatimonadota bacterium]